MSSQRYTPEFKDEAVRQILERGVFMSACTSGQYAGQPLFRTLLISGI